MAETHNLPRRMFASGHEPVGLRVSPYHKPGALGHILESLEEDEIEVLKRSPFGRFIELADKTPYSGRLGRYMLSRQLKVRKKYEAWFLFSENPIRFSLREFAVVTGLPCGKYPKSPQKGTKKMISEQPMLKRKTITDRDARIKYACLAILAYVILPTTHVPKILIGHAEKIRDLDEFFAYPWGRVSFEMLMSSIKERDEVALTQNTIALQGYVHSLQLVMTKAVPALTEVVRQDSSTDAADDDDDNVSVYNSSTCFSLFSDRCHDNSCNRITKLMVRVTSIIEPDTDFEINEECLCFSDEENDDSVDKMVSLIRDGTRFTKNMFIGGATTADVKRMREEAEAAALAKKKRKRKTPCQTIPTPSQAPVDVADADSIAQDKIKVQIDRVESKVDDLRGSFDLLQEVVKKHISENSAQLLVLQHSYKTILDSIASLPNQSRSRSVEENTMADAQGSRTQTAIPEPQRVTPPDQADMVNEESNINQKTLGEDDANVQSYGEEQNVEEEESSDFQLPEADSGDERMSAEDDEPNVDNESQPTVTEDHQPDPAITIRKSTRLKAVTKSLVGVYQCDKLILNRFREAQLGAINKDAGTDYPAKAINIGGTSVSNKDVIDIAERTRALSLKLIQAMEVFSSDSLKQNRLHSKKYCHCGYPSSIKKSWTDKNPGRLFLGCQRYQQEQDGCNFFEWYDVEEVRGWAKRSLIEARDEIRAKDSEIRRLTRTIATLRRELENHRLAEGRANQPVVDNSNHNSHNDDLHEPSVSSSERLIRRLCLN
ncbi:unnamed protein product [Brassica rapa subsp. narinosa]